MLMLPKQIELQTSTWARFLKWAQVEVCSSIHLGAAVFQSWCYFQNYGINPSNFESLHLIAESFRSFEIGFTAFRLANKNFN